MADLLVLRDGSTTSDTRLGRLREFDERSRQFAFSDVRPVVALKTTVWKTGTSLDQLAEGTCVGHGFAHECNATPVALAKQMVHEGAVAWFDAAAIIDPFPGVDRAGGTSVLAGAKIGLRDGYYGSYRWCFSLGEVAAAIVAEGPVVVGTDWYSAMYDTDALGRIRVAGNLVGGHCYILYGYIKAGDFNPISGTRHNEDIYLMQNSWGPSYGLGGCAWLYASDFDVLRLARGEVLVPMERKDPTAVPKPVVKRRWRWMWDRVRRCWRWRFG